MNTQEISNNVNDISIQSGSIQNDFCKAWPTVKPGLLILIDVLKNPVLKVLINSIIATGDALQGKICGG